jgi:membrane-bound acyltransferase YfiQ involved in biofilm formation
LEKDKKIPLQEELNTPKSFFDRYGVNVILGILILYVILLLIGTVAEIFHIDSILDWWIWRPVGK